MYRSPALATRTATLGESALAHSSLRQRFTVSAADRYLRFTVDQLDLHQATPGAAGLHACPPDAFEVALLHADTGLPLWAIDDLSECDALLNIQPDGTERRAAAVLRTDNPDGSRTYTVDLRTVAPGTPLTLSVALLGFGAIDSHVFIRDIRLVSLPEAHDDTVTTAEDTPIVIDALANDTDPGLDRGFFPEIVDAPRHGTVSMNAGGAFTYTPAQDFSGTDAFTYRLSDGSSTSNVATVTITVSPVDDAPVAGADTASAQEDDARITIPASALLANDTDADAGDTRTIVSVGPSAAGAQVSLVDGNVVYDFGDLFQGLPLGASAIDTFTYTIADSTGLTSTATVTMRVSGLNDAPLAGDDTNAVREDGPLVATGNVLANDTDPDAGTTLVVATPGTYPGQYGTLSLAADGSYTYTLANDSAAVQALRGGQVVSDVFSYAATDGLESQGAQLVIVITGVNDAPVALSSTVLGSEDTPYVLTWSDLHASDVDSATLALRITELPAAGDLQRFDGSWTAATVGQTFTRADVEAGLLRFVPGTNESGCAAYPTPGLGNRKQHYAQIRFRISDGELESAEATLTVDIQPVPDAPVLQVESPPDTSEPGAATEIFRTSWESAVNQSRVFTLVHAAQLEGWSLVTAPPGSGPGQQVFEIWSSGDRMRSEGGGPPRVVHAAEGNGNSWLHLNDGQGQGHQTLGIERSVATLAGATYTLKFDYAGYLGAPPEATRIGVHVDGALLASYAGTSPAGALDWRTLRYYFVGTGGTRTIRIMTEPTTVKSNGHGAMIDDIALREQQLINTGPPGLPIRLGAIEASLADDDGSEVLTLFMQGLPPGAVLTDGTHSFTASDGHTTANIMGWTLGQLSIMPASSEAGSFKLDVVATATETATGASSSTTVSVTVTIAESSWD